MATTKTLTGRTFVEAPSRTPRPGGLLDAAQVRDYGQGAAELRGYTFQTDAAPKGALYDYATGPGAPQSFDSNGLVDQDALVTFDVEATAELTLLADLGTDPETLAAARLAANESRLVEQTFLASFLLPAASVLNGGTPVKPAQAIALLEEYADSVYLGQPLIHAPRRFAVVASSDLLTGGPGNLTVRATGSTVAVGAGYAAAVTGNTATLYATGQVLLARTPVDTFRAPFTDKNRNRAYATRTYLPSIETFTVAVKADLS